MTKQGWEKGNASKAFELVGRHGYLHGHEMADQIGITHGDAGRIVAGKHGLPDELGPGLLARVIYAQALKVGHDKTTRKVLALIGNNMPVEDNVQLNVA